MSYRTSNIIVQIENDEKDLTDYFSTNYKFFNIRKFHEPFSGIICQANEKWKDYPFEKFSGNYFKNQDEVEDYFGDGIERKIDSLSKQFPEKQIAFIYVDCFGGRCTSEGYVVKDNIKVLEQESHYSGHKKILQKINPDFDTWFFYPFTRTFFSNKGGIHGDIINFSFIAVWMVINQEFGDDKKYNIQANQNEMLLGGGNEFTLYFMKVNDDWIKIMGSILVDDENVYQKIKDIINENFVGMEYNIQINNFETGEVSVMTTIDEKINYQIKANSHRATAFNVQSIDLSNTDDEKTDSHHKPEIKKKGFFRRLFGR